jgi:hypothetical protein
MYFRNGNDFVVIGEIFNVKPSQKNAELTTCGVRVGNNHNNNDWVTLCDYDKHLQNVNSNSVCTITGYVNNGGVHIIQALQQFGTVAHKKTNNSGNANYNNNNNNNNQRY